MNSQVFILNGIPGVGKTTTAKILASSLQKSVILDYDFITRQVVSGFLEINFQNKDLLDTQRQNTIENICLQANFYIEKGFSVVIDCMITKERLLDIFDHELSKHFPKKILLTASVETILNRDKERPVFKQNTRESVSKFKEIFDTLNWKNAIKIDTTELSEENVVGLILKSKKS